MQAKMGGGKDYTLSYILKLVIILFGHLNAVQRSVDKKM